MPTAVDHRVTPSLHPDVVKQIEGYDADTEAVLAPTLTAFDTAYQAVVSIHEARAVAERNPAWTEENRLMQLDALAAKKLDGVTRLFDSTRAKLVQGIAHLEGELSQPVKAQAGSLTSSEIRAHVAKMTVGARQDFIQQRIDKGDEETVSAVLGGPAYLSGLTDEMRDALLRQWHTKQHPDKAKRLKAMIGARELIEHNAPMVFPAFEKAAGGTSAKAKKVREANAAAERLFAAKDA